ncbi:hypothetical protein [Chryseobacterium sp. SC28]|uniref:hypothetical protein n=1 Tax=Chryseobacterium sp. SC28 TaxID=2268028 RepID=UPI000F6484AD|nr:hypothetical protein [Chryseobacterium sp. SC28]RRQ45468.1 hypothetical protein DTW91_09870 [Chryseobacterium sp. SC28]
MNINLKQILFLGLSLSALSCVPDSVDGDGNGLAPGNLDAAFTVAETSANHYKLTAKDQSYLVSRWNLGDGSGFYNGKMVEDIFLPDAGVYQVQHQAIGQGGIVGGTASQTVTVAVPDPVAGNLVQGGKFLDAADWSKWTINNTGPGAQWVFTGPSGNDPFGKATLTATDSAGQGIYQAIQVVAGRKYNIDMVASSTSGCVDTWFEVYCGYNVPIPGSDYNGDGTVYRSINTWDGSGKEPFSGKISIIGAVNPSKNSGIFTATQNGTVYLGIRGGGADMKDGISITNVEFRGTN